tara:strand:- start:217 stop:1098 length:882 start_codon:yes stop_codon:yes gene_type:complete
MSKQTLAFIGGSGLYDINFLDKKKIINVNSKWGKPSGKIIQGKFHGKNIFFLSRHGKGHVLSPSNINYRSNIDCLKQCGVTDIISISAVGSLKKKLTPGTFVVVDQFIDRTFNRKKTFFDEGIVAHVPLAQPTSKKLRLLSINILKKLKIKYQSGGTYITMEGPQFSTKAESELYRSWEADVIGMTNMPEAKLSREAEIRYCSISMVTDYDCWNEDEQSVDVKVLLNNLKKNAENAISFIKYFTIAYSKGVNFKNDDTSTILDTSIVTNKKYWKKNSISKLKFILERYIKENK